MDLKSEILKLARRKKGFTSTDAIKKTSYSKAYVHRIIQRLADEGLLYKTGSTKNARYIEATKENISSLRKNVFKYEKMADIPGLEEHLVLEDVRRKLPLPIDRKNIIEIFAYAFTELLNNAIEHSGSQKVHVVVERNHSMLTFEIRDYGVGIFNNIRNKLGLESYIDAVAALTKGKLTTAKEGHTGEGIFFTSKAADSLIIQSSDKKLIFNNILNDVFVRTIKDFKGTKVRFNIKEDSSRELVNIFNEYAGIDYAFDKTKIQIKLFSGGRNYISRSEARRVMAGIDKFKTIILNFKDIETIGQGFADEVFRVWKIAHPEIEIKIENANDDVMFMINRTVG
jgi:anti-sigma regulatory factor (Ser/Thr protein kinase)